MFKVSLTQNDIDYRIFSDICSLKINMDKLSAYVIWKCMIDVLIFPIQVLHYGKNKNTVVHATLYGEKSYIRM